MNGFSMMSNSYKNLIEKCVIDKCTAEKKIRIFDFLATCDEDDISSLFNSGAFNEIVRAYVDRSVNSLVTQDELLSEEQAQNVKNRLEYLFDMVTAKEILEH